MTCGSYLSPPKQGDLEGPFFWALPFFLSKTFFSFEEGCAFVECALMVEPGSWESLLSQMADYIVSTGRSPAFFKSFFFLVKDIRVLDGGGRIETGTGLAGIELAMSDDAGLRIHLMQQGEDLVEDNHLLGRAVVLVLVLGTAGVATLETDPDRVTVPTLDVTAYHTDRTAIIETTIPTYIKVIAREIAEATCTMAGDELADGEVLVGPSVGTVQHEQINSPR